VSISTTSETELKFRVNGKRGGSKRQGLPIRGNTMVNDCPCFLRESVPNNQCSFTRFRHTLLEGCLRFDTATNDIDSPGRADQRVEQRILENRGFNRFESIVGCNRSQDRFLQGLIDLCGVDGSAEQSVVEHVSYTKHVIVAALRRTTKRVPRDSLAGMGFASISVTNAANRPML